MSDDVADRVLLAIQHDLRIVVDRIITNIQPACESPIEVILGATIISLYKFLQLPPGIELCWPREEAERSEVMKFQLYPQYPWNGYRIDWVLKIPKLDQPYIFIECDGHDFHERTKEQAERDRSKDRAIQAAGIPILRFTGREIYRDAMSCVVQVYHFVDRLIEAK